MTDTVGIRELRQNLSRYLDRVKDGDRLVVTERNQPVAVLAPLPEQEDQLAPLIAAGLVRPATRSVADMPPPIKLDGDPHGLSKALEETRGDR
jgi:prevent-host-death family protein